jgi:hypothetical protein
MIKSTRRSGFRRRTERDCSGMGKPRAILEVKSPDIPAAVYEARLRGYDQAARKPKAKAKRSKR